MITRFPRLCSGFKITGRVVWNNMHHIDQTIIQWQCCPFYSPVNKNQTNVVLYSRLVTTSPLPQQKNKDDMFSDTSGRYANVCLLLSHGKADKGQETYMTWKGMWNIQTRKRDKKYRHGRGRDLKHRWKKRNRTHTWHETGYETYLKKTRIGSTHERKRYR